MIFNDPTAGQEPTVTAKIIGTLLGPALEVVVQTAERAMVLRFGARPRPEWVDHYADVVCDAWERPR